MCLIIKIKLLGPCEILSRSKMRRFRTVFVPSASTTSTTLFQAIVKASKAWSDDLSSMEQLWSLTKEPLFSLSDREKQLGLGKKGITTYFTPNCDQADADKVNRFFKQINMEGYINRVIKTCGGGENGRDLYEIRHAAAESSVMGDRQGKTHCSKSSFFVQKFNFDFPSKLSIFFGVKNS